MTDRQYKEGNTAPDGTYIVGKYRTPEGGKYRKGDGRPRGRRPKGVKNFDTELLEEANRTVRLNENGKVRRVSKRRSVIIRALDNAGAKGQNAAIQLIINEFRRIAEKPSASASSLALSDAEIIERFLADRLASFVEGDSEDQPPEMPLEDPEPADE